MRLKHDHPPPTPISKAVARGKMSGGLAYCACLCTLPLSTLLQGHFYLLCTAMVIANIWFGSWGEGGGGGAQIKVVL